MEEEGVRVGAQSPLNNPERKISDDTEYRPRSRQIGPLVGLPTWFPSSVAVRRTTAEEVIVRDEFEHLAPDFLMYLFRFGHHHDSLPHMLP